MTVLFDLRRATLLVLLAAGCGLAGAQPAFPARPIRLVVPYGPGGIADLTARIVAQKASAGLGQPIVVENRPGAGSVVAATQVAKADADGYTLLLIGNSSALTPMLFKSLPYDVLKDFAYVASFTFFDFGLLVPKDSPFHTVGDLMAYARQNPGKVNIGTISPGTTQHLASELLKTTAAIPVQTVPFKSTAEVMTALGGKEVQAAFEVISPVLGQIQSGNLRVLGVASTRPLAALPNVPTIAATVPGFAARSWNGIAAPARTPAAVIARLHKEIDQALADPEVKQKFLALGVEPVSMTPEQTRAQVEADMGKWKSVIEQARIERQ